MKSFLTILFGTMILYTTMAQAEKRDSGSGPTKLSFTTAPNCEGRPDFITEVRPEIIGGFAKLPQIVLVANEADYYIESKSGDKGFKVHSYQSFTGANSKNESKIICGSFRNTESFRFSLFAPTLIDTTRAKRIGQSLWQFQLLADKEGFSVWNKRSLAFKDGENLEKVLMKFGGNYRIYQLSPDQFEVVVSKDTEGIAQYLSVRYDALRK